MIASSNELETGLRRIPLPQEVASASSAAGSMSCAVNLGQAADSERASRRRAHECNAANDPQAWRPATGLRDWSFLLNTAGHGSGPKMIVVRLTEHGAEVARDTVRATFR